MAYVYFYKKTDREKEVFALSFKNGELVTKNNINNHPIFRQIGLYKRQDKLINTSEQHLCSTLPGK